MLKSNWNIGQCKVWGRAYVIRQRIGHEKAPRSNAAHKFMTRGERMALCQKLEARASR